MWIGHCGSSAVLRVSNNAAMNIWKMYWTDGPEKLFALFRLKINIIFPIQFDGQKCIDLMVCLFGKNPGGISGLCSAGTRGRPVNLRAADGRRAVAPSKAGPR